MRPKGDESLHVDERLRGGLQVLSRNLTQPERSAVYVSDSVSGQVVTRFSELVLLYQMQMTTRSDPGRGACISVPQGEPDDFRPQLLPQAGIG